MSLRSKLRDAEDYGAAAAHAGAAQVRSGMQNVSAGLRKLKGKLLVSVHADPEQERERSPQPRARTGIVSVNGRDVGEMRTGGRHSG